MCVLCNASYVSAETIIVKNSAGVTSVLYVLIADVLQNPETNSTAVSVKFEDCKTASIEEVKS